MEIKEAHMFKIRRSQERGSADHGWLQARHSFSFGSYYDPRYMGFKSLRVINEDKIQGGTGFGAHPHSDMEIITYIVQGALEHQDSMGNRAVIVPGEVQHMSAGSGVTHSEFNEKTDSETHLLQIWIMPNKFGTKPGYGQKSFEKQLSTGKLVKVASPDGSDGSLAIQQNACLYIARPKALDQLSFEISKSHGVWIQVVSGEIEVLDQTLKAGDAIQIENETSLYIHSKVQSEFLLFDLA